MATTYYTDIQKLYVAYFNRPADPAGLAYWETVVEGAKGSTAAVSASFAASAEYKATYANMTNAQVVDAVYQNLFGRAAEAEGKAYWADLLDKKAITVDNVVAAVSNAALGSDKTSYTNKVSAASAFTTALDTPAEQAGYTAASVALAKAYIAGVTTDASLAAAITPATLNATVSAVVIKGTPFNLSNALASYNAANKAVADFLDGADGTVDGTTSPTARAEIGTKFSTAEGAVDALVAGNYAGSTVSATVKSALLNDQISVNNTALVSAQAAVSTANADIAKNATVSAAVTAYTSAITANKAADTGVTAAAVDLGAKLGAYNAQNTGVTVAADGTVTGLIIKDADGKLVLASTSITETTNPGITALLASTTAKEAADTVKSKAVTAEANAKAAVDYADMSAAEKADLTAIVPLMKDVSVATGSLPTVAQILAQKSVLDTKAAAAGATADDLAAKAAFDTAYGKYTTDAAAAGSNPLYSALTTAQGNVTTAQGTIKALTDAVATLNTTKTAVDSLAGLDATVTAATAVFAANNLVTPTTVVAGTQLATAGSDIFVAGKVAGTINLFGVSGSDSLYVGKDYVLNTGKITTGSDSALEVFIAQSGSDTTLKIEQHAFSSNVTGVPANEVVTITLQGVNATDVHLNNGIITVGTTA